MERLTKRLEDGEAVMDCGACGVSWHKKRKKDIPYCTALFCRNRLKERLAAYEDTGLEPEEVISATDMAKIACALHELNAYKDLGPIDHLRGLIQAEQAGLLVVLDEPQKPLVWGDDNHDTILCPTCKHDLMGGFQEADSCEAPMYQCPYCGQPIDGRKALTREEAEAALSGKAVTPNG